MEPMYEGEPILAVAAVDELTAAEAIEKIVRSSSSRCRSWSIRWRACGPAARTPGRRAMSGCVRRRRRARRRPRQHGRGRGSGRGGSAPAPAAPPHLRRARASAAGPGAAQSAARSAARRRRPAAAAAAPPAQRQLARPPRQPHRPVPKSRVEVDGRRLRRGGRRPDADGQADRRVVVRRRRSRLQGGRPRPRRDLRQPVRPAISRSRRGRRWPTGRTASCISTARRRAPCRRCGSMARWVGIDAERHRAHQRVHAAAASAARFRAPSRWRFRRCCRRRPTRR